MHLNREEDSGKGERKDGFLCVCLAAVGGRMLVQTLAMPDALECVKKRSWQCVSFLLGLVVHGLIPTSC